jgi:hypothetical protein
MSDLERAAGAGVPVPEHGALSAADLNWATPRSKHCNLTDSSAWAAHDRMTASSDSEDSAGADANRLAHPISHVAFVAMLTPFLEPVPAP